MKRTKPNILWYCTDQQRFDTIRSLGNTHINTPNLDRFAGNGVAFKQAYCQSPICTPSRASFLTGRYPNTTHVHRNGNAHFPESETLVTNLFAEAGYRCGLVGKLHLASAASGVEKRVNDGYEHFAYSHHPMPPDDPTNNAYHRWLIEEKGQSPEAWYASAQDGGTSAFPAEFHQTTWATEEAIKFIDAEDNTDQPWMLSVNIFDPHPPFDPPAEYAQKYDATALPGPLFRPSDLERQKAFSQVSQQSTSASDPTASVDNAAENNSPTHPPKSFNGKKIQAAYYAMIELIDDEFGRLIDHLEQSGELENTLIVFHSDHGELLGDHGLLYKGCRFFEGLVHVPLMFAWQGQFISGETSDGLVELVDIAPTLLDAAGLEIPNDMQGKSLVPLLTGEAPISTHKERVICEFNDALGSNADPRPTHATMSFDGRYKLIIYHGMDLGELFDLEQDPGEFENLWNDAQYAQLKSELLIAHIDAVMAGSSAGIERVGRF